MLSRVLAIGLLIAGSLTICAQTELRWTDQGEAEIGLAAQREGVAAKKLELLAQWEQRYPNSTFTNQRRLMMAQTLLTILGSAYGTADPARLEAGEKAGSELTGRFNEYFDDSGRPQDVSSDKWSSIKQKAAMQLHTVLAYIAQTRKDDATAEVEYRKVLEVDPSQARASYALGSMLLRQMAQSQEFTHYSEAIYEIARSLAVTGPNALNSSLRATVDASLRRYYGNYHGSLGGVDNLIQVASASALPPSGFHLLSVVEAVRIRERARSGLAAAHPDLFSWQEMKTGLTEFGETYFFGIKNMLIPVTLQATVVSQSSPKEILVDVDNAPAGDAILRFVDNFPGAVRRGSTIRFKGMPESYATNPYVLTVLIKDLKNDVTVLNRRSALSRFFGSIFGHL